MYVYDLEFTNKTKYMKKGFNADSVEKSNYTYIEAALGNNEQQWFIIQKFLHYSKCTMKDHVEADFFLLPLTDPGWYWGFNSQHHLNHIEQNFSDTFHRRGMKDHIIINFHNTKKGSDFMSKLSNRSVELVKPMAKVVVEIFGYYFWFKQRRSYAGGGLVDYDTLMTVVSLL